MAGATGVDSPETWLRLLRSLLIGTIGGVGMWSVVVVLPAVQAEFGVARGDASLSYTATMLGFALGGLVNGRIADRYGIFMPVAIGSVSLGLGYVLAGYSGALWQFALLHGLLIGGFGASAVFGPLMADVSHWFVRRRGLAVAICASGNYLAGVVWPPLVQAMTDAWGWRSAHVVVGLVCLAILPLSLPLRRRLPPPRLGAPTPVATGSRPLGLAPGTLQGLLMVAGVACCVAMAMPQVHIVAYCGDLGYGVARGTEMLSLMLGFGIVSRVGSGWIADRIGGLGALLLGSVLQGVALTLYLFFDGLVSLYVISALFGLFQGGIVPSYAIVVREQFRPQEAATRVGGVLMATLFGMAFGGWISGVVFDLAGSYQAAFANGVAWNLLNAAIIAWLLARAMRWRPA